MDRPHQRKGAKSNAHLGAEFERQAMRYFGGHNLSMQRNFKLSIGLNVKKVHAFDLGNREERMIVECKSHTWTSGGNVPSAKMVTWNEAMYLFHVTPTGWRKILFVLKDYREKRKETLAEYYIRTYAHLIPDDVEIWEFDNKRVNSLNIPR